MVRNFTFFNDLQYIWLFKGYIELGTVTECVIKCCCICHFPFSLLLKELHDSEKVVPGSFLSVSQPCIAAAVCQHQSVTNTIMGSAMKGRAVKLTSKPSLQKSHLLNSCCSINDDQKKRCKQTLLHYSAYRKAWLISNLLTSHVLIKKSLMITFLKAFSKLVWPLFSPALLFISQLALSSHSACS